MATGPGFILIAGPTASGKSALALDLAQRKDAVIINTDSMQIYEGLPLLTAQPDAAERELAEHRLYGEIAPDLPWSVAAWLEAVRGMAAEARSRGKCVILCGGTGLYFRAAEEGLSAVPAIDPAIRRRWREFAGRDPQGLHMELHKRDSRGAGELEPGDRQRLVRALEVLESTGKPLRDWHGNAGPPLIDANAEVERYLVMPERSRLHERIDIRFDKMIEAGAVEEAEAFLARKLDPSLPAMKAIGLREIGAYLEGETTLEEAVERAKAATRQYAKRQVTWFRHQLRTPWKTAEA